MDILGVRLPEGRAGKVVALLVISSPVIAVIGVGAYAAYRRLRPRPETDEDRCDRMERAARLDFGSVLR